MVLRLFKILLVFWCFKRAHLQVLNFTEDVPSIDNTFKELVAALRNESDGLAGILQLDSSENDTGIELTLHEKLWRHLNLTHKISYRIESSRTKSNSSCFYLGREYNCPYDMLCFYGVCKCSKPRYIVVMGQCYKQKEYNEQCDYDAQCYQRNMVCSNRCICKQGYFYISEACILNSERKCYYAGIPHYCGPDMKCVNDICECSDPGYTWKSGRCIKEKPADYNEHCKSNSDCKSYYMECSNMFEKCICKSKYYYNGYSCSLRETGSGNGIIKRQEIITAALIAVGCIAVAIVCVLFLCVTKRINQIRGNRQIRDVNDLFRPSEEFQGIDKPPTYDQFLETERAVFGVPPPDYDSIDGAGPSISTITTTPATIQPEITPSSSCPQLDDFHGQLRNPRFASSNPSIPSTSGQFSNSTVELHLPSQWLPISANSGSVQDGYVRFNSEDAASLEGMSSQWMKTSSTCSLVDKEEVEEEQTEPEAGIANQVFSI